MGWISLVSESSAVEGGLLSSCSGFPPCRAQALGCSGFSSCSQHALEHRGLVAARNVRSSQTWEGAGVPCIARWILNHWTTREARLFILHTSVCTCQSPNPNLSLLPIPSALVTVNSFSVCEEKVIDKCTSLLRKTWVSLET